MFSSCNPEFFAVRHIHYPVNPSSDHFHTDGAVPCSDHCCTVLPSRDHYSIIETVAPSGDHCFPETVAPSSDHYSIVIVVPSSDHCSVDPVPPSSYRLLH